MSNLRNQRGVAVLEVLLLVVVLVVLGFVGYRAYQANNPQPPTESSHIPSEGIPHNDLRSEEFGFKLVYPAKWGTPTLAKGKIVAPGEGSYQQLTFADRNDVDINFVLKPFFSPLDGCPEELLVAKHQLSEKRASIVGWTGSSLKRYGWNNVFPATAPPEIVLVPNSQEPKWTKVKSEQNVLIYKDADISPVKPTSDPNSPSDSCLNTSKTEADEANTYYNYVHFARNFKTSSVVGVNAHYNRKDGENKAVIQDLADVLTSLEKL